MEGTMEGTMEASRIAQPCPWNGVNLGGWLILEPGTAGELFAPYKHGHGEVSCEWELMKRLRADNAVDRLWKHRDSYITREGFQLIRDRGLNAVRLPLGYWTVLGPAPGEPYEGPALEYVDRAVAWAEEVGLQIILDLHGCPGGESADPPCGHQDRSWSWQRWRFNESLDALKALCLRYRGRKAVTGVEVCNEPSHTVPLGVLCTYYFAAVNVVRSSGMSADEVAVILPVFQRSAAEFADAWNKMCQDSNVCFDFHYYHCFGNVWNGMSLAESLRAVEGHVEELRRFPAMVGEWSLAIGDAARTAPGLGSPDEVREIFGRLQGTAYRAASHGHFFWNYKDDAGADWDWLRNPSIPHFCEQPITLPAWSGKGEDPLEEICDPSPPQAAVCIGDVVFLRAFQGRYLEADGSSVASKRRIRSKDCQFTVMPPLGQQGPANGSPVVAGAAVRLLSFSGRFLAVQDERVVALQPHEVSSGASEFVLKSSSGSEVLRHRGGLYLKLRSSNSFVEVDASDDSPEGALLLRKAPTGPRQRLTVLKVSAPSAVQRRLWFPAAEVLPAPTSPQVKEERMLMSTPPPKRRASSSSNLARLSPAKRRRTESEPEPFRLGYRFQGLAESLRRRWSRQGQRQRQRQTQRGSPKKWRKNLSVVKARLPTSCKA